MPDRKLAALVQETLNGLSFSHFKNQGRNVTEFQVSSPCPFIVTVENLSRWQIGFPFRSRARVESALELRRLIGSGDTEERLRTHASVFLQDLRKRLPDDPWKGLGIVGSRQAKEMWQALGEL